MKPETIKWIDRRLGVILCWIFSVFQGLLPTKDSNQKSEKLLFIKLIEQGASVLAYSALKRAVDDYGKSNVYFLVFSENRPILDLLDVLDSENIIEINNTSFSAFGKDLLAALIKLRRIGVDSALDMEFFSRASVLIAYLSGAKKRVGLHSFTSEHPFRGDLITHKIHYNPYVHVSQYYLMLVEALKEKAVYEPLLKSKISEFQLELPKVQISSEKERDLRVRLGLKEGESLMVLNPNASDMLPLRRWPSEKFTELLVLLKRDFPQHRFVFTGLAEEKGMIGSILGLERDVKVINAAGKTDLMDLMTLYQMSDLVLTNDSGPGHFASLFDTQVLVMFGPETPELFAPQGEHVHIIYKKLACSPCVNVFNHRFSPCSDNQCMKQIQVEEVAEKIKTILHG